MACNISNGYKRKLCRDTGQRNNLILVLQFEVQLAFVVRRKEIPPEFLELNKNLLANIKKVPWQTLNKTELVCRNVQFLGAVHDVVVDCVRPRAFGVLMAGVSILYVVVIESGHHCTSIFAGVISKMIFALAWCHSGDIVYP
jgi:hypothetical protein